MYPAIANKSKSVILTFIEISYTCFVHFLEYVPSPQQAAEKTLKIATGCPVRLSSIAKSIFTTQHIIKSFPKELQSRQGLKSLPPLHHHHHQKKHHPFQIQYFLLQEALLFFQLMLQLM